MRMRLLSAEFSPDGRRVVTASNDATAQIWDAKTGKALNEPLRHEKRRVLRPVQPGRQVAGHRIKGQDRPDLGREDRKSTNQTVAP